MGKMVPKYVAFDGSEFDTREECAEWERKAGYTEAVCQFVAENFYPEDVEEVVGMRKLWDAIYENPESFAAVLAAAKRKPLRGRPKGTKNKAKKDM